jgi:signal transduction histidine kinase
MQKDTQLPWKILLVEDDEDDYLITRDMLSEARKQKIALDWARNIELGKQAMEKNHYDVILVDYDLGEQSGLDLLHKLKSIETISPVIVLTGNGSYEVDIEAMKAGAADYLDKNQVNGHLLERTIRYAIETRQAKAALMRAKEDLENRVAERTLELLKKNEALVYEIIERNRIEAELAETQRRLIDNTEAERLQLAQELHDGPMQELYVLTYQLEALRSELEDEEHKKTSLEVQQKIKDVIHTLRTTSGELRPPALAPYGLEKAIRSHAEQFQKVNPNLKMHLQLNPDRQAVPERVRLALFRIYQTALANVVRHAQAENVHVRLALDEDMICLEIKDDGRGFSLPKRWIEMVRKGHLGLVGAHERAEAVDGKLDVKSAVGEGTLVRVEVPRTVKESLSTQKSRA